MKFRCGSASAVIIFSEVLEVAKKNIDNSSAENNSSIECINIENRNESNSNAYCDANNNFKHTIYYGVTVSKKVAKKAVVRNRIKRLMRESLRTATKEFEIKKLLPIKKIIISYFSAPKHPMQISLNDVLPAVKNLLEQAYLRYDNNNSYGSINKNQNNNS